MGRGVGFFFYSRCFQVKEKKKKRPQWVQIFYTCRKRSGGWIFAAVGPRRYKHVTSPAVTAVANGGDKRQSAAVQSGSVASGIFQGALETEEGENKAGPIRPAGPLFRGRRSRLIHTFVSAEVSTVLTSGTDTYV